LGKRDGQNHQEQAKQKKKKKKNGPPPTCGGAGARRGAEGGCVGFPSLNSLVRPARGKNQPPQRGNVFVVFFVPLRMHEGARVGRPIRMWGGRDLRPACQTGFQKTKRRFWAGKRARSPAGGGPRRWPRTYVVCVLPNFPPQCGILLREKKKTKGIRRGFGGGVKKKKNGESHRSPPRDNGFGPSPRGDGTLRGGSGGRLPDTLPSPPPQRRGDPKKTGRFIFFRTGPQNQGTRGPCPFGFDFPAAKF